MDLSENAEKNNAEEKYLGNILLKPRFLISRFLECLRQGFVTLYFFHFLYHSEILSYQWFVSGAKYNSRYLYVHTRWV